VHDARRYRARLLNSSDINLHHKGRRRLDPGTAPAIATGSKRLERSLRDARLASAKQYGLVLTNGTLLALGTLSRLRSDVEFHGGRRHAHPAHAE
jgi:hypothetical protein